MLGLQYPLNSQQVTNARATQLLHLLHWPNMEEVWFPLEQMTNNVSFSSLLFEIRMLSLVIESVLSVLAQTGGANPQSG